MKKKVINIYQLYNVPTNLAEHMLLVAALGHHISQNWLQPTIDEELLIDTLLLHDIGNLVKFNLNSDASQRMIDQTKYLLNQSQYPLDYWQKKQQTMIDKYSGNADHANIAIVKELTDNPNISNLLENHSFESLEEYLRTDNWEKKLVFYCDLRFTPTGLSSIEERIEDLRRRYQERDSKWLNAYNYQTWLENSLKLEQQLDQHTAVDLRQVKQTDFDQLVTSLAEKKLEVRV